jgi:hypothetical protein
LLILYFKIPDGTAGDDDDDADVDGDDDNDSAAVLFITAEYEVTAFVNVVEIDVAGILLEN